jgi:hypothetical protein
MRFEHKSPIAGEEFSATAADFLGRATIEFYIDDELVHLLECPDPPCHDSFLLADSAAGKPLIIVGKDDTGEALKVNLEIRRPESVVKA